MLLNHTMLNDDAYRTGTAQSPICECVNERETVQHFLFRCPLYREGRICMLDLIKSICASRKGKTHLDILEFLLLAPTSNGCVSRDNKIIKAAVFEFIEISGRKITFSHPIYTPVLTSGGIFKTDVL